MDNYYFDKYNLEHFSDSTPRKSRSGSSDRPPRPQRSSRTRKNGLTRKEQYKRNGERARNTKPIRGKKRVYSAQRKPKSPAKRAFKIIFALLIVGLLAGTVCVVGYNLYMDNKKNQPFKFSENVKISGINIGGLSMDGAKAKLEKNRLSSVNDVELKIVVNENEKTYSKSDFTYTFDYDTPLQEAKIYSLKEQGIYDPPDDSAESADDGELKMPKLKLNYTFNQKSAVKLADKIAGEADSEPQNATVTKFHPFSDERFEYKEGVYGFDLDEDDLASKITEFMRSGDSKKTIEATGEQLEPSITVADLREKIVGISTATSTSYNTENGNINMATALKACNGSVIEPGGTWSFNECTGDSNDPKNGYKKATVITDRKLEEGYGGGICQASTTIFQAGALANMGIAERHNHYWASGYALSGEDATIDYPNLDLKLTNPTEYQMFIECKMDGNVLICNIYGVQEDYYDNVKLYTKNYDIIKKKSYSTHTLRVLYLDGKIVSEDTVCESEYSLTDKHAVQDDDPGTYRTMVDGTSHVETEPSVSETEVTETTASEEVITDPQER